MHICHVNLASGFSGGERQTLNLIQELAEQGVHQTLVAKKGSRLLGEVDGIQGLSTRETAHFVMGHSRGSWNLIHCHDGKSVYWAWLESVARKTPYVVTRRVDNRLGEGLLTQSAYRRASAIVCLSTAIKEVVTDSFPELTPCIIPSSYSGFSVNLSNVRQIRDQYAGKVLVGQVGRLLKHKGFQVTISAAKELIRENPKVHFLFVGEGPDEDWLKEQSRGLGNVDFVGYQENVGNWISAFDIFLFPSLTEGLGSTILEAMQLDVPVIAARAGGIPDLVTDHVNGLLVPPGDASALSRAISQLVDNPSLSLSLKKGARLNLHKFSPQRMATEYRSLYQDILHGHS